MSSSCRRVIFFGSAGATVALATLGIACVAGSAIAADTTVQPQAELRIEENTNRALTPGGSLVDNTFGYVGDVRALIDIATPRSNTTLLPRLRYQDYPDLDTQEKLEISLDMKSVFRMPRDELAVIGEYERRDLFSAELPGAGFDPINPDDPTTPETGQIRPGETRTMALINPSWSHEFTERTALDADAYGQVVRYETEAADERVDYDFAELGAGIGQELTQRTRLLLGAFLSNYEATDGSSKYDAYGGEFTVDYKWSDVDGISFTGRYETDDITNFDPTRSEETASGWGADVTGYRKSEVSEWRVRAGRFFTPSGRGGKSVSDQVHLQYDRNFSPRLEFRTAARYVRDRAISDENAQGDRDYARFDVSLRWWWTETVFLRAGYDYIWQEYQRNTEDADNNQVYLSVGYRGLERQR